MARIRTVKPEFWTSEQIVECSRDARLLFIGLWNFCDDFGVHPNSAKTIKARVFPGDDDMSSSNVRRLIDELTSNGLIGIFVQDDIEYIHVLGWDKHQKIERPNRKHPHPPKNRSGYVGRSSNECRTIPLPFDDQSPPEGNGRERKGMEESPPTPSIGSTKAPRPGEDENPNDGFEDFYRAYPRKVGRGDAEKAYRSARKAGATRQEIQAGVMRYVAERFGQDPKFTKHASSWLNSKRWLDAPPEVSTPRVEAHPLSPAPATPLNVWQMRIEGWKLHGLWLSTYGPRPDQPGCQCPREAIELAETASHPTLQAAQ